MTHTQAPGTRRHKRTRTTPHGPGLGISFDPPESLISHHGGREEHPAGGRVETRDHLRADILEPLRQDATY